MNPKIVKIDAEHAKNAAKIARLQARNRDLEKLRTELENTDIIGLVREMGLTPDQLAALIHGKPLESRTVPEIPENVPETPESIPEALEIIPEALEIGAEETEEESGYEYAGYAEQREDSVYGEE